MPGSRSPGCLGQAGTMSSWHRSIAVVDTATAFNASGTSDRVVVSNGVDFFQAVEASQVAGELRTLRGGWGNDWDLWPASLAERTSRTRRALARIRTAEALAAWVHRYDTRYWPAIRDTLEEGLFSAWKYFEHGWAVTGGDRPCNRCKPTKRAGPRTSKMRSTTRLPRPNRSLPLCLPPLTNIGLAVFNPVGSPRTDVAEFHVENDGPYIVRDVATQSEVPSQIIQRDGHHFLQFLANNVPSLGISRLQLRPRDPLDVALCGDRITAATKDRKQRLSRRGRRPGSNCQRRPQGVGAGPSTGWIAWSQRLWRRHGDIGDRRKRRSGVGHPSDQPDCASADQRGSLCSRISTAWRFETRSCKTRAVLEPTAFTRGFRTRVCISKKSEPSLARDGQRGRRFPARHQGRSDDPQSLRRLCRFRSSSRHFEPRLLRDENQRQHEQCIRPQRRRDSHRRHGTGVGSGYLESRRR